MAFDPDVFTIYNEEITFNGSFDAYSLIYAPVETILEVKGEINGASVIFNPDDYLLSGAPFPDQIVWLTNRKPDHGSNFTVSYTYVPTFDSIQQYMLQTLQLSRPDINTAQGSAAYNLLGATAQSIADLYQIVRYMQRAAYLNTADAGFLDEVAITLGAVRNPAIPASGIVQLHALTTTLNAGTIQKGFQVGTFGTGETQITFSASAAVDYPAGATTCSIPVIADVSGQNGNLPIGTVTSIVDYTPDFVRCNNLAALEGGVDAESDDVFRARIKHQRQLLGKCTRYSLQYLCESVPGIKQAVVQDKNTNGEFDAGNAVITLIGNAPLTDDSNPGVPPSWAYVAAKSLCLDPSNCPAGTQLVFRVPAYFTLDFYLTCILNIPSGVSQSSVVNQIVKQLQSYIDGGYDINGKYNAGLTLGTPLYHQQLLAQILDVPDVTSVSDMVVSMHVTNEKIMFDGMNPDHLLYPSNTANCSVVSIIGTVTVNDVKDNYHTFVQNRDYTVVQRVAEHNYYLDIYWQSSIGTQNPDMDSYYYIDYLVENTNDPILPEINQIFKMGTVTLI